MILFCLITWDWYLFLEYLACVLQFKSQCSLPWFIIVISESAHLETFLWDCLSDFVLRASRTCMFLYAKFIYSGIMFNQALISNIWWSECWIFGHLVIIKYWSDVERNQNFNWDITFFWLWWISSLKMWWKSNKLTSRYRFQIFFYTKHVIRGKPCPCKRLWYRIHNSNTLFEKHYRNMKRLGNLGNRRF